MANQLRTSGVFNLGSLGGDGAAIVDADFDSVVLLLDGDGTNGQTTFTDLSSSPHTITTNGNAQVDTAVKKFGTGSIEFDGTGDYLTGPTSTDFAFGPDDFTIESWVYFTGFDVFGNSIVDTRQTGNVGILLEGSAAISGQYYFRAYNPTSGHFITSSQALSTNTWYHVALVRNGNNYKIFVNGVSTASVSNSVSLTGQDLTIGASYDYRNTSGTAQFTGYLDDLRITKGVARYSSSFTPPTSALPVESDTVFLVRGDNGGTDVSDEGNNLSANNMSTVSSTVYSSPQTVFDFNGSTSYLISSGNPYSNLDDGDPWTIEFWAKLDANAANTAYGMFGISDHTTGASGITIRYYNGWNWWVDGFNNQQTHQTTATTGTWYHIALVYNGSGNSRLFVDGVPSTNALGRTCVLGTEELTLGRSYEAYNGEYFNGQLADVRITKGVVRYPQRLPPISALPTTGTVAGATRPTRKWGGLVGRSLIASDALVKTGNLKLSELLQATYPAPGASTWDGTGAEILLVGGGGAGGGRIGGGGGGGAMIELTNQTLTTGQSYSLTVGAGGLGKVNTAQPEDGGDTTGFTYTATGGGYGGVYQYYNGNSGGSGGGGAGLANQTAGTTDNSAYGKNGGSGYGTATNQLYCGGGGGGRGSAGAAGASNGVGGIGGNAKQWAIDSQYHAGGGQGCPNHTVTNPATSFGAGAGNDNSSDATTRDATSHGTNGGYGNGGGGYRNVSDHTDAVDRGGNGYQGVIKVWVPVESYTGYTAGTPANVSSSALTYNSTAGTLLTVTGDTTLTFN